MQKGFTRTFEVIKRLEDSGKGNLPNAECRMPHAERRMPHAEQRTQNVERETKSPKQAKPLPLLRARVSEKYFVWPLRSCDKPWHLNLNCSSGIDQGVIFGLSFSTESNFEGDM